MSNHLSDNPSDWPEDVYALLGVDRDADTKTLRRAYTRLIRRFKPDHYPSEFQRIREAYDAARKFAELRKNFEPADGDWSDVPARTIHDRTGLEVVEPHSSKPDEFGHDDRVLILRSNFADESADATAADSAWRTGREGDLKGAFDRLELLHERDRDNEEVIIRLYWIRKLLRQSDGGPAADLVHWLCQTVKSHGSRGRLWQLLLAELQSAPDLSTSEAASKLLESPDAPEQLVPLLLTRWRSAGHVEQWASIDDDLNTMRRQLLPDLASVWIDTVLAALRILVWSRDTEASGKGADGVMQDGTQLFERWFQELNSFEECHLTHPHVFDERDELVELREQLQRPEVHDRVRHLLLEDTVGRGAGIRNRVLRITQDFSAFPEESLGELDALAQSCPMVLVRLWRCIQRHNSAAWFLPEGQGDVIVRQVDRMIQSTNWNSIFEARIAVYNFCVHEALPLRRVAHAVTQSRVLNRETMETLSGFFYGDAALACLCECAQAGYCQ